MRDIGKWIEKNRNLRESHCLEFKEKFPAQGHHIGKLISAFANHEGGYIYFGITDKIPREFVGINDDQDIEQRISGLRNKCDPKPLIEYDVKVLEPNKKILIVHISSSDKLIQYDGRFYYRDKNSSNTRYLTADEIKEKYSVEFSKNEGIINPEYNNLINYITKSATEDWTFIENETKMIYKKDLNISVDIIELDVQPIKNSYPPYEKIYNEIDRSVHGDDDVIYRYWFNIKYKRNIIEKVIIMTHDFGHRPYLVEFPIIKKKYTDFDFAVMRIVNKDRVGGVPFKNYTDRIENYLNSEEFINWFKGK